MLTTKKHKTTIILFMKDLENRSKNNFLAYTSNIYSTCEHYKSYEVK